MDRAEKRLLDLFLLLKDRLADICLMAAAVVDVGFVAGEAGTAKIQGLTAGDIFRQQSKGRKAEFFV